MHLQVGHSLSSSRLSTSHPAFHLTRFTQKTDKPAPRQQNSPDAFERPPFVLHSSNQVSTAHLLLRLRLRGRIPSHLYANYFATWTKVITLSDSEPTGLKSKAEINKLPPLNDEKMGTRAARWLMDQLEPPFKSSREATGWRQPRQRSMHQTQVPLETTLLQRNSIRSRLLTYPASDRILQAAPRTPVFPAPPRGCRCPPRPRRPSPAGAAGGGQGWGRAPRPPGTPGRAPRRRGAPRRRCIPPSRGESRNAAAAREERPLKILPAAAAGAKWCLRYRTPPAKRRNKWPGR